MPKRARNRRARVVAATGITVAVLVAGGGAVSYATSRSTAPTYVSAAVGSHPVSQTLEATGTTQPSRAATVSFAVSGTVATVPVTMGTTVKAGQVLATLDTTSLKYALAVAQSHVANAKLTLAQAESGQISSGSGTDGTKTSSTSSTGATASKTSTTGTTRSSGSSPSGSSSAAAITAAQKNLLANVRQADSLMATTKTDLAVANTLCSSQSPTPSPTQNPTPSPTQSPIPSPTGRHTAAPTGNQAAAPTTCAQAQQLVLNDESQLFALQQGVSGQVSALDKLITRSATGTGSAGPAAATSPLAKASVTTTGAGPTTVAISAVQLATDQAAVDAANASLAVAQQQSSQATIVSPFTGVVSSVGLNVGQQATAGSASTAVDVIDPTGHSVTLSVDVTKIPQVKVGQKATVLPDGSSTPLAATVSYVAAAPTSGTAYTVQLAFTTNPAKLRDGIQAAATITTAAAANALAVPTSAVNHRGGAAYVLVLNGSTTKTQPITVGAVGAIYTQVTSGLTPGQRVVLANPNTPIPSNTITGRIARITGGVTNTTGVLGSSSAPGRTRPGG
jgi:RND family efflux transporter MFP subunit